MKEILTSFINEFDNNININKDKVNLFHYTNKDEIYFDLGEQDLSILISNLRTWGFFDVYLDMANICGEFAFSCYTFFVTNQTSLGEHEVPGYGLNELFTDETKVNLITTNYKLGYHNYLQTKEWHNKRNEILKFSNYKCSRCNEIENLQVHHLNYNTIGDESLSDLEVLCVSCHKKIHQIN